jgi:hypothetical protein
MIRFLMWAMLVVVAPVQTIAAMQDNGVAYEVALGDAAYAKFDNPTALQHYLNALAKAPDNYQALWKGAITKPPNSLLISSPVMVFIR